MRCYCRIKYFSQESQYPVLKSCTRLLTDLEYGHPYLILQNKHSHLNKMIQDAGPLELHNELFDIAKQAYMSEHTAVIIREESIESVDTAIHI
ncbi:hypothetical protein J6590_073327 [Homalodisca vitripennis]|nr:hypothetical protein J6590_073327 [Homalodisca vitripennis]KAG8335231.1 hypothetical protein J6590_073327 [Homalodisca vitripennis]